MLHFSLYLQSRQVARQLLDNWFEGARVGLGITNQAEVKQEGIPAVFFVFNAHRTSD